MKRERGVALITVLLIVAIVTVVTAALVARQHLAIRSSANQLNARQACTTPWAAKPWPRAFCCTRHQGNSGDPRSPVDHLGEAWAPAAAVRHRAGRNRRAHQRPVRALQPQQPGAGQTGQPHQLEHFQRLQHLLGIERNYAPALVDWLDEDQQVTWRRRCRN